MEKKAEFIDESPAHRHTGGMHTHSDIRDSVKADLLNAAAMRTGVTSLWSTFVPPDAPSSDTLRNAYAPAFTLPDIAPKIIAYPKYGTADADYTIVGMLGEGGMGIVFEAEQRHLRQHVALKMIKADRANDPLARNSFFYEAVVTAGLDHPGIIPVLEFGVSQDSRVFYVMKKASGVPWHRVIREKSRAENLDIFNRVADVVGYAHSRGVIHRDLKPSNILLGEYGEVWVGDWGVALHRNAKGDYTHAHPGGTPQYMPPEMARCDTSRLGPRSDVYLLGGILFEIITGMPPHAGEQALAALSNAADNSFAESDQDDSLLRIARTAMADDPEQRHADVAALKKAVRDCLAEDECALLLQKAEAQFSIAREKGEYEAFQQSIDDYEAAIKAFPRNRDAADRKIQAIIAYSRQALANGEYNLALSVASPMILEHDEIAALAATIKEERNKELDSAKKRRHLATGITLGVGLLLACAVFLYEVSRRRLEDAGSTATTLAQQLGEAQDDFATTARSSQINNKIIDKGMRELALDYIRSRLPGGINLVIGDFLPVGSHEKRNWDVAMNRLEVLFATVRRMIDAKTTVDSDDSVTEVYQELKSLRPDILKEIESVKRMGSDGKLTENLVDVIVNNLMYLATKPDTYTAEEFL